MVAKASLKKERSAGRPSDYRPGFARIVYKLRLLGISSEKIADLFEVRRDRLWLWREHYPEFKTAWIEGGSLADATVARSLYHRAVGYSHTAEKIFNDKGSILRAEYTEHYPPDTAAAQLWLVNRQPELWRNKSSSEVTGANGTALFPPPTLVFDFSGQDGPLIDGQAEPAAIESDR